MSLAQRWKALTTIHLHKHWVVSKLMIYWWIAFTNNNNLGVFFVIFREAVLFMINIKSNNIEQKKCKDVWLFVCWILHIYLDIYQIPLPLYLFFTTSIYLVPFPCYRTLSWCVMPLTLCCPSWPAASTDCTSLPRSTGPYQHWDSLTCSKSGNGIYSPYVVKTLDVMRSISSV